MPPKRDIKKITIGDANRIKLLSGARQLYEAVSSTYGPAGNNVVLRMPFGDPVVTRDGVTVARRISSANCGLEDQNEDDAARLLYQASEKTNKTAGDGTTATVVMGYNLLDSGMKMITAGDKGMLLSRQIKADSLKVLEYIKSKSIEATPAQLLEVATVSGGDANIGKLVAETLAEVGQDGGITIREQQYPTLDVEKVNGYYFDKGFYALNGTIEYEKPLILVTQRRLVSNTDILPLLQFVATNDNKKLVVVGDVSGDALNTMVANAMKGVLEVVVIPPPAYNQEGQLFMEDIATYVGCELLVDADNLSSIFQRDGNGNANPAALAYFGSAERVQVNQERSIIFGGAGDIEKITDRASEIKQLIDKEVNAHMKDQLESRYSKLVGKIAIVNVGGATTAEMEELRFRVEDALEATKSAMADGIVPGGATTLAWASTLEISPLFANALTDTFKKLFANGAESADYRLKQVLESKFGCGFNLRDMTEKPIDLAKAGIWDATRSVTQIVENATSAASTLLTCNAHVGIVEKDAKTEA